MDNPTHSIKHLDFLPLLIIIHHLFKEHQIQYMSMISGLSKITMIEKIKLTH
jgi:hypothetical protein